MVLVGFVMAMTAPIELLYAIKLGLSTAEVTAFIMVSALGVIAIDVLGTRAITRIDARATIATGLVLFAASEGCYALSRGATGLLASRVLQGAGLPGAWPWCRASSRSVSYSPAAPVGASRRGSERQADSATRTAMTPRRNFAARRAIDRQRNRSAGDTGCVCTQ